MYKKTNDLYQKLDIDISVGISNHILRLALSSNESITPRILKNAKELVDSINDEMFSTNINMQARLQLMRTILKDRVESGIEDAEALTADLITGKGKFDEEYSRIFDEIIDQNGQLLELDDDLLQKTTKFIGDRLTNGFIYRYEDVINDLAMELSSREFDSLEEFNEKFMNVITSIQRDISSVSTVNKYAANDFGKGDSLKNALETTIKRLNKKSNIIQTGLKTLNKALGSGGIQAGRVYLFLGLPKGFKSGILLNICLWAMKYNQELETKDKTKVPCILYLTQENSIFETLERIWSHYFGDASELKNYSPDEAYRMLQEEGFNRDRVHIEIKFRPHKSIKVAEIEDIINDISKESNAEVVMVVQDYVKRIRPNERQTDIRLELGEVVNDMTILAKKLDIPFVTASQLNREAFRVVENAVNSKKANAGKMLGASAVGESMLMIENVDFAFIISKEFQESTKKYYLTFKNIASRGKTESVNYFAQPFEDENGMKLVEDVNLTKSAAIFDLGDGLADFDPNESNRKISQGKSPTINRETDTTKKVINNKTENTLLDTLGRNSTGSKGLFD